MRIVEQMLAQGNPEAILFAADHWDGGLLEGLLSPDPEFDAWLSIERTYITEIFVRSADVALAVAVRTGCEPDLHKLAEYLIRIEPTNEAAHSALIGWALDKGNASAALRRYEACREAFRRDLDSEPPLALRRLAEAAQNPQREALSRQASGRSLTCRRLPSVALIARPPVGPPEFTNGLAGFLFEELVGALGRSHSLALLLPTHPDERLDATYTLTMNMWVDERRLQASFRLSRNIDRTHLLSERMDNENLGIVAESLADLDRIVSHVEYAIATDHRQAAKELEDAYSLWLNADQLTESFRPADLASAVSMLHRAAALDSGFSRPIAGLASIQLSYPMANPGNEATPQSFSEALALAKNAVAIDPWDARNHGVLGWAYYRTGLYTQGEREFRRAVELDPCDPLVLIAASEGLAYSGDANAAVKYAERAFLLHPAAPDFFHCFGLQAFAILGAYERALFHGSALRSFGLAEPLAWNAFALAKSARHDEARASTVAFLQVVENHWGGACNFSPAAALKWLDQIILVADRHRREEFLACIATLLTEVTGSPMPITTYTP
ncbi:BTAD domain-containing putative transcriptional regulator [Mesorhizobium sp. M7D.F.Ca.US.005.01.1.1]|uniref:BTAD domain-containing putative transcriptional regulator n=1 Tax=Mesorhizobium sp. M7D.F.Ca.US.005.01.1.1 TaxID=2493678 RepID=UPI0013DF7972|nr:BTAD domain-containing putative transcriptional regulator [Mesorhizobium sp. M7D.F.Ca.US.005.01.1.1]